MSTGPEKEEPTEHEKAVLMGALRGMGSSNLSGLSSNMNNNNVASALRRPAAATKHDRKVSWDMSTPSLFRQIPQTPSHDSTDKVSVRLVQNTFPVEDEADKHIMRAIEQSDIGQAQMSILGNVPAEKNPFTHRRVPTTSETLWNLASEMQSLHTMHHYSDNKIKDNGEHTSDSEAFVNNAATILLRNRSKRKEEQQQQEQQQQQQEQAKGSDPAARWGKLRTQVMVTGALNSAAASKKNDEPVDVESVGHDPETHPDDRIDDSKQKSNHKKNKKTRSQTRQDLESDFRDYKVWLQINKGGFFTYLRNLFFFWLIPCVGVAALLYYLGDNPPCGTQSECVAEQRLNDMRSQLSAVTGQQFTNGTNSGLDRLNIFKRDDLSDQASISWWILFLGVRQVVTFSMARMTQAFLIDFLALRTRIFVKVLGPFLTLMFVQSRGWPCIIFWWSIYDYAMLYGKNEFARHWMFFQDSVELFNDNNPSGGVTYDRTYLTILCLGVVVGTVANFKRLYLGILLGKQTFGRFAPDLTKVMRKCLLVGQVAGLALDIQRYQFTADDLTISRSDAYNQVLDSDSLNDASKRSVIGDGKAKSAVLDSVEENGTLAGADITGSIRVKIDEILGAWEEPDTVSHNSEKIPISSIIQFRQSLSYLNATYPFGVSFGQANSRETMVENAEAVYQKLLSADPNKVIVNFDTFALLAIKKDGALDVDKLKELVTLFRPQRDGSLSLLDFAKSVDSVYKELRLLRASVANSTKLDRAFEKIVNMVFYFVLGCIILAVLGIDPLVLFASISGFVLGFAFMFGAAASKYFEGLLMIIVRKPYAIGDRINLSDINTDTPGTGSPGWIVKDIGLFSTTVVYGSTNEEATLNNGAMASSRIINLARSKNANLWFLIKFPIDTPYHKIKIFSSALESFVKDRPREWKAMLAFRATNVAVDFGYVEYICFCQHREAWQSVGPCLQSKADLSSFALELAKKMDLRYHQPPKPIDLTVKSGHQYLLPPQMRGDEFQSPNGEDDNGSHSSFHVDIDAVAAMFRKDTDNA